VLPEPRRQLHRVYRLDRVEVETRVARALAVGGVQNGILVQAQVVSNSTALGC